MDQYIANRVISVAHYIIDNQCTIRQAGTVFGYSKSTIHIDMQSRLSLLNKDLYIKVQRILDANLQVRHIRGGQSTKNKYLMSRPRQHS